MRCPNCGTHLPYGANFCISCGLKQVGSQNSIPNLSSLLSKKQEQKKIWKNLQFSAKKGQICYLDSKLYFIKNGNLYELWNNRLTQVQIKNYSLEMFSQGDETEYYIVGSYNGDLYSLQRKKDSIFFVCAAFYVKIQRSFFNKILLRIQ